MPFEHGSVTCRFFSLPRKLPEDAVERFAEKAAPPLDTVSNAVVRGWVTGRHLLDRNINETTAFYANYLRLTLLSIEKKIPTSLLKAECKIEEIAQAEADGTASLSRTQRAEIKKSVEERLLPQMPPQLKGIHFVQDESADSLFTSAASIKDADTLITNFSQRMGFSPVPILPQTLALELAKIDVRDWHPTSFSPDLPNQDADSQAGREFLTWAWFIAETQGGKETLEDLGEISIMIEGPLTFAMEGEGAHETIIRKGEPLLSAEAKTCLLSGKKLKSAKLTLVRNDEIWETTIDADEFVFRSLKLPKTEAIDPVSRFQERMGALGTLRDIFYKLYGTFLGKRNDAEEWKATQQSIHQWVRERRVRLEKSSSAKSPNHVENAAASALAEETIS